jgi:hypothetical protein
MKKAIIGILAVLAILISNAPGIRLAAAPASVASITFALNNGACSSTMTLPTTAAQVEADVYGPPGPGTATVQYQTAAGGAWAAMPGPTINGEGDYIYTVPTGALTTRICVSNTVNPNMNGQLMAGLALPAGNIYLGWASPSPGPLASVATGATAYVYQTLQSFPVQCYSFSPTGQCLVIFNGDVALAAATPITGEFLAACVAVSSTPSPLPTSVQWTNPSSTTAPCASSAPTNALAGSQQFGQSATSTDALTSYVHWSGTMPSGQAITLLFQVEGSTTSTQTAQGSGSALVIPF